VNETTGPAGASVAPERDALSAADVQIPHPDEIFVGGRWRPSSSGYLMPVVSPESGTVVSEVVAPGLADADEAVELAAQAARGPWPRMSVGERVAICRDFCYAMEERTDELVRLPAIEAGIPVRWGRTLQRFAASAAWTAALDAAEVALETQVRETAVGQVRLVREPVGPVLAVMPFNAPVPTLGCKVVPALLAGAPVVVKAAPESALTLRVVAECAEQVGFPPGVLSFLAGDVEVAKRLVDDERIELISFTGGTRTASDIVRQTAPRLPRLVMELGGKSPAVLLDDVDLDKALRPLVGGAMSGTGQVCALLSRVLVPAARHDEIVEALRTAYQALRIGSPLSSETDHGPLISRSARDRTDGMVQAAVAHGARLVTGGRQPDGFAEGWFYEPTLLTAVDPQDDIAQEEVFGPVTVVLPYEDVEQAVELANGTAYGLAASVFGVDRERALQVARRIRAGSVAINTFGPTLAAPFGGVKRSGWGRESGPEGIQEFTDMKQVLLG
jgi:acyl-CoA reductase-like NAD-dependent aldehyde dehydrogenase